MNLYENDNIVLHRVRQQQFYTIDLISFFLDVPNPPGRPMVTGFTSRSMTLSWSKPRQTDAAPVLGYVITTG